MSGDGESPDVREMLELQLAEVEMLESMFSNPGEFTLDSNTVLEELRAFVNGTINYDCLESRVGFTVKIVTSSSPVSWMLSSFLTLMNHLESQYSLRHEAGYLGVHPLNLGEILSQCRIVCILFSFGDHDMTLV